MTRRSHTSSVAAFFDGRAAGWSSFYRPGAEMAQRRAQFAAALRARLPAPAAVLDLGCGSGEVTRACADAGYDMTGVDVSARMLAVATARHAGERCRFREIDPAAAPALPFPGASFGAAIASSVLEYVPDAAAQLRELRRVLRPGGWLLATVPDMRHPLRAREQPPGGPWWDFLRTAVRRRRHAEYLRHSLQRVAPERWREWLVATGFEAQPLPECESPLLLLEARARPA